MAYRKYNTYYKKKYGYRKNYRKYSKFNLYKNRSSKSQAYQIYNLNKKINNIEKKTKPEVKPVNQLIFDLNQAQYAASTVHKITKKINFTDIIQGNLLRLQNILLYGNLRATDSNNSDNIQIFTEYFRFMVVQTKTLGQVPPDELLLNYNDMSFVRSPLNTGFSQTVKLIYDKVYVTNNTYNSRNCKINLKKLSNIRRKLISSDPVEYQYEGDIYVYIYIGNTASTYTNIDIQSKICYVEDD